MKKNILILTIVLSTQILFSGCSATSTQNTQSPQKISNTENSVNETNNFAANGTNLNSITNDTSNGTSNNTQESNKNDNLKNISKKDVQTYLSMTKVALIKKLGKNYKLEGGALIFPNGLSFYGLDSNKSKPTIIKCNSNTEIIGIKNGMTFNQVQSILGKSSVIETYLGTKRNKIYKIQYSLGKGFLKVISSKNNGENSFIEVSAL